MSEKVILTLGTSTPVRPTTPAPKATAAPAKNHAGILLVLVALVMLVFFAVVLGVGGYGAYYFWTHRDQPAPSVGIAADARDYVRTIPGTYFAAADKVDRGEAATEASVLALFRDHATPLASATSAAFKALKVDAKGNFADPKAVSSLLRSMGNATAEVVK